MAGFMGMPGTVSITNQTNAAVLTSGKPVRVFSVFLLSDGTASTVSLYNGTAASGTAFIQIDGVISKGATLDFANGILFPNGCFASVDSHTVSLTIACQTEC